MTQTAAQRRFVRTAAYMNSKARRLGTRGSIRDTDLAQAFLDTDGACPYCGVGINPLHCSFDHVVPFDRGGENTPANIVACCMSCQRSKSTKLPVEFETARNTMSQCEVCGTVFKPRFADWVRGYGRTCSRACSGRKGGEATKNPAASGA